MANRARRLSDNVDGEFFVDSTCIDCSACRWIAPASFDGAGDFSVVVRQPTTEADTLRAEMALLACPVGSIGTEERHDLRLARSSFPYEIADGVYHCGYHSRDSFGAASYLIVRDAGNVMVDSPRFTSDLVRRIEELGGIHVLFLTHRDDVADHQRFADHFGCERILHRRDRTPGTRSVERFIQGEDPVVLDAEITLVPVPGHTRGSMCMLYRERFLFSGDHLAYSPERGHLVAFRGVCWYSWSQLTASMRRLSEFRFEWVLPGHGHPCHFDFEEMRAQMKRCLEWL